MAHVTAPGTVEPVKGAEAWHRSSDDLPYTRYATFFTIALAGGGIDLATKSWIFDRLGMPGGPVWWIWPEIFGFQTSLNQGALFGIGQGQVWLFATLSVLALAGIGYWLFGARGAHDRWMTVALAAITAGILGNLYDRLGLWSVAGLPDVHLYAVRDWILFQYRPWNFTWPNFNIADSLLVCGAGMIVWSSIRPTAAGAGHER